MNQTLLKVENLTKRFVENSGFLGLGKRYIHAVESVSFELKKGEVLGLVGESGSGKTTLGRCVLRLIEPSSGEIEFDGKDILNLKGKDLRWLRRKMQIKRLFGRGNSYGPRSRSRSRRWADGSPIKTKDAALYGGNVGQPDKRQAWKFFKRASEIDPLAAIKAGAWGSYQVLGGHLLKHIDTINRERGIRSMTPQEKFTAAVDFFKSNPRGAAQRMFINCRQRT